MRVIFARTVALSLIFLGGCAAVDQYGSRIYDANLNSQNALNQEILLNIVRASKYQSANFMAISQVSGGQTEVVSTGLPTISFGPGQTAANHVYQVSNSVQSTVQGGYQSNPLISTAFQNGMMTPVSPRSAALLVASRPREIVFFLLLGGIEVVRGDKHFLLNNDPSHDLTLNDSRTCDKILQDSLEKRQLKLDPGGECSFTKFKFVLQSLIGSGLTAELVDAPSVASSTSAGASNPGLPGHICFNPAIAGLSFQKRFALKNICAPSIPKPTKPTLTRTESLSVKTTEGKTETTNSTSTVGAIVETKSAPKVEYEIPFFGKAELRLVFRSPIGVMNSLGVFLRDGPYYLHYASLNAQRVLPDDEPYLSVVPFSPSGCYTSIDYSGMSYCVPATSAHTPMIMDMVESLRNLNIQPADLNSAFTVRLSP